MRVYVSDNSQAFLIGLSKLGVPEVEIIHCPDNSTSYAYCRFDETKVDHKNRRRLGKKVKKLVAEVKGKMMTQSFKAPYRYVLLDTPYIPEGIYNLNSLNETLKPAT